MRLLIFPQPLGGALKNQSAAPASPPCFRRRRRSGVSVSHKEGRIEHLYVTEASRGRGLGVKMLDFARKKLEEHPHPVLSVLDTNARAKALYTRMGWRLTGEVEEEFDPAALPGVVHKCAMVTMRYEG